MLCHGRRPDAVRGSMKFLLSFKGWRFLPVGGGGLVLFCFPLHLAIKKNLRLQRRPPIGQWAGLGEHATNRVKEAALPTYGT